MYGVSIKFRDSNFFAGITSATTRRLKTEIISCNSISDDVQFNSHDYLKPVHFILYLLYVRAYALTTFSELEENNYFNSVSFLCLMILFNTVYLTSTIKNQTKKYNVLNYQ